MGMGGRSQTAASTRRTASIGTTIPRRFSLFPIQLMTFSSRGGDPAHLAPLQSRIWPSSHFARSHTAHAASFQQVRGKPKMDPPSPTTGSQTLLGPKSIFAPPEQRPEPPQRHGSRSWVTNTGTPDPTNTHPVSRLQDSKTKFKTPRLQ